MIRSYIFLDLIFDTARSRPFVISTALTSFFTSPSKPQEPVINDIFTLQLSDTQRHMKHILIFLHKRRRPFEKVKTRRKVSA